MIKDTITCDFMICAFIQKLSQDCSNYRTSEDAICLNGLWKVGLTSRVQVSVGKCVANEKMNFCLDKVVQLDGDMPQSSSQICCGPRN